MISVGEFLSDGYGTAIYIVTQTMIYLQGHPSISLRYHFPKSRPQYTKYDASAPV